MTLVLLDTRGIAEQQKTFLGQAQHAYNWDATCKVLGVHMDRTDGRGSCPRRDGGRKYRWNSAFGAIPSDEDDEDERTCSGKKARAKMESRWRYSQQNWASSRQLW
eukprot:6150667-Pyramimonas_sp.AAC.1